MFVPTGEQTMLNPAEPDHIHHRRAKEFIELHDQVQTSVDLLDSLESFLSTFQKDLSAVSGQISELQDRSKDIENRLKSRRRIEKPLSSLISDLTIPPALATLILGLSCRRTLDRSNRGLRKAACND
ncbi:hypothetical protein FPV67DRAFT_421586 [Lyophyllum atratum]|nr:hypothetical protein FPV67DRAFT_421586 [Lyophyllum atratum]